MDWITYFSISFHRGTIDIGDFNEINHKLIQDSGMVWFLIQTSIRKNLNNRAFNNAYTFILDEFASYDW